MHIAYLPQTTLFLFFSHNTFLVSDRSTIISRSIPSFLLPHRRRPTICVSRLVSGRSDINPLAGMMTMMKKTTPGSSIIGPPTNECNGSTAYVIQLGRRRRNNNAVPRASIYNTCCSKQGIKNTDSAYKILSEAVS